jgi:hypothetical protein
MGTDDRIHQHREPAFLRLAKGIAAAAAEYNELQRMQFEMRMDPEQYVFMPHRSPDTFAEFMIRTSGTLPHEPSARERTLGQDPRR